MGSIFTALLWSGSHVAVANIGELAGASMAFPPWIGVVDRIAAKSQCIQRRLCDCSRHAHRQARLWTNQLLRSDWLRDFAAGKADPDAPGGTSGFGTDAAQTFESSCG